jgi:predicted Zn finger-like uncharacterized protein
LLTHEPQNREMALIRCPSCDTLHDLEGSFFAAGPRKVRCASCRTVWEATDPESPASIGRAAPRAEEASRDLLDTMAETPEPATPLDQAAIDAIDFSAAEPAAETGADISADELEALFAGEAAAEPAAPEELPAFDPESLARSQDAVLETTPAESLEERRKLRREKRLAATDAHHKQGTRSRKAGPVAAMAMAAGLGTFAVVGFLHNEVVRLFPASASLFEAVGLGQYALDIANVHSQLIREENRETLEVSGTITNHARTPLKIPVLRLSIRSGTGQEIYVWTATADRMELLPGEKTTFTRRLASPPQGSHSVLVRFVAKDDIVAAIN